MRGEYYLVEMAMARHTELVSGLALELRARVRILTGCGSARGSENWNIDQSEACIIKTDQSEPSISVD